MRAHRDTQGWYLQALPLAYSKRLPHVFEQLVGFFDGFLAGFCV